jgi:uncharacterized protein (DUF488 family)
MSADSNGSVLTAGYEGKSLEEFLLLLAQNNIQQLLDVRYNPVSRKKGFSKSKLSHALENAGITYVHIKELGIPSQDRKYLKSPSDYAKLFKMYQRKLLPQNDLFVRQAAKMTTERHSVIMCFEHDASYCHRSSLAKKISTYTGSEVIHI